MVFIACSGFSILIKKFFRGIFKFFKAFGTVIKIITKSPSSRANAAPISPYLLVSPYATAIFMMAINKLAIDSDLCLFIDATEIMLVCQIALLITKANNIAKTGLSIITWP